MKILVTGNGGIIGRVLEERLKSAGFGVAGFDLRSGQDILDRHSLIAHSAECDAVVHLAARMDDDGQHAAEQIIRTNVTGTRNVLEVAHRNGFKMVIFMSSVDALGIFKGESAPAYFPVDDAHPCAPVTSYGISKKRSEEDCRSFHQTTGIPAICLRPPGVWEEETYRRIAALRRSRPDYEWHPYWEYGAFLDVRDLATLVIRCLQSGFKGYGSFLACADDISTSGKTGPELVRMLHPEVPWKDRSPYEADPCRSLLDNSRAKAVFGWNPEYSWRRFTASEENEEGSEKTAG
jgi:UDP-glucose 4-epimerase